MITALAAYATRPRRVNFEFGQFVTLAWRLKLCQIPSAAHGTPCGGRDDWPHRCRTTLPGSQTAMVPAVHPTPPAESGHNSSKTPETRHPQLPA